MQRPAQERRPPSPEPVSIPPMGKEELEAIGLKLFGRVGWTVKIAKLVGKDASTLRRWRAGSPIEPVYAKMIRDYAAQHADSDTPSWDDAVRRPDSEAMRALKLVARAQTLAGLGAAVALSITDTDQGLCIVLRIGGRLPLTVCEEAGGGFHGLHELESALAQVVAAFQSPGE